MIKLHHGSYTSIDHIDLSKSKSGKDFGKGFYLSGLLQMTTWVVKYSYICRGIGQLSNSLKRLNTLPRNQYNTSLAVRKE